MQPSHIIHIDDHLLFRDSHKNVIQQYCPFVDLYQFTNSDSALEHIIDYLPLKNPIKLIVTDFTHRGKNAIEFAQQLAFVKNEHKVDIPVILLTMRQENEEIQSAITSGYIDAYVSKSASTDELIHALEILLYQKRLQ